LSFTSVTFLALFLVALGAVQSPLPWRARKGALLVLSYAFYSAWNPPFVVLLWLSTVVDWWCARGIHAAERDGRRKLLLGLSCLVNLGVLASFKYAGFLVENLHFLGLDASVKAPDFALPVGISFYTFQTLSYTIDVYRRRRAPADDPLDFALYVTFFPQLVAGPIVRAEHFLPQLAEAPKAKLTERLGLGLCLVSLGLFEKSVLADGLLAPVAERVFDAGGPVDLASSWAGALAFSGQIFCDFAGYSTIAIGVAAALGFTLPDNFRFPYAAVGFSDFWERWHISLSSWLRDYLYIPLGGSRQGVPRTLMNLVLTMFLGGLWHGASWTFVAWGLLHGAYLVGERLLRQVVPFQLPRLVGALLTFLLVSLAWVFFRAETFSGAFSVLSSMFGAVEPRALALSSRELLTAFTLITLIVAAHHAMGRRDLRVLIERAPPVPRGAAFGLLFVLSLWASGEDRAFLYFQF
jgi:alginate O-acetyltransferase complex protein AlgI